MGGDDAVLTCGAGARHVLRTVTFVFLLSFSFLFITMIMMIVMIIKSFTKYIFLFLLLFVYFFKRLNYICYGQHSGQPYGMIVGTNKRATNGDDHCSPE